MKKKTIIIFSLLFSIVLCAYIYINDVYKSEEIVKTYLTSNKELHISEIKNGYYFDHDGENKNAIIFYPGAKVEYTAYAPLMNNLANNGIDCFLIKMPLNFAFLNINAADDIINNYKYDNYYLAGHSLGGVAASSYTIKNSQKVKGIILLASYSTKKFDDKTSILSIYGDMDGVLNIDSYNKNKKNFNDDVTEVVLNGANHAGFGYYGNQNGDKESTISKEEQQKLTIDAITNFIVN